MKVVLKTDEYTVYQRRDQRYAVRGAARAWVNGDAKVAILLEHKLIEASLPKQPAPEPEQTQGAAEGEEATATEEAGPEATLSTGDAPADDEQSDEK